MIDVFNKAYANKFTKTQKRMLVGTTYHKDTPFLFNTTDKNPNPGRILTRNLAVSVNEGNNVDDREENEFYERVNDTIKFKVDFEDFCYQSYLTDCGYDFGEFDIHETLYNHNVECGDNTMQYPQSYVEWFEKFTGVVTK
jgi:hypothetical protein